MPHGSYNQRRWPQALALDPRTLVLGLRTLVLYPHALELGR